jgi:uncharacterized protein
MLIEFRVKNFLSIREEQVLSLMANSATELNGNTLTLSENTSSKLVRSAVIYGANASGKSNLLSALFFMGKFVVNSAKESQHGEKIRVEKFAFDQNSQQEPSEFEITFMKEGVRYQYGFSLDEKRIYEEWLFAYPSNHAQKWFSRVYDKETHAYSWKFSKFFKSGKSISDLTLENILFLSNAVKLNNSQLIPVFDFFQKNIIFLGSTRNGYGKSLKLLETENYKQKILKIVNVADSSITDIKINKEIVKLDLIHFIHCENIALGFPSESRGTQRTFAWSGYWLDVLENGGVLIVDELDNSLHPFIARFLINLICNPEINKKNAQLIFTTHDTSLLDNELFRRDQIWFVERDKYYATQLYPLLDFSPRKNEALGKGYLNGRYGALPFIGEWRF